MLKTLAEYAKRIRTFLGFAALIILALVSVVMWIFSQGAFNPLVENVKVLSPNQFFGLILTVLVMVFVVVILLILLSYRSDSSSKETLPSTASLSVIVHEESDATLGVMGASVTLSLSPEPVQKETDEKGNVIFFFPPNLIGKKLTVNARKTGYAARKSKTITLTNGGREYISLSPAKPAKPSQSTLPDLAYFLYVSDSKIDMLEEQVAIHPGEISSERSRYQSLTSVLAGLERKNLIGDIHSNKPFVSGEYPMRWGVTDWGGSENLAVSFFFTQATNPMLLMAGSVHHLVGHQSVDYSFANRSFGAAGSALPGIMRAIKFAIDNNNKRWSEGIGGVHDYLFALGFVHDKFVNETKVQEIRTNFPEQPVRFVAKSLKRLTAPTEAQLKDIFTNPRFGDRDKQELRRMLRGAPDILVCTPVYVALSED